MNKLNKLVTNYPVELTPEEVGNLSLTLSAVRTAGAAEEGKTYKGEGFVTVNNTNNTISLTTEATEKLNQPIPTKVSDLTDSANYQTKEGMNDYLTKTSASENLAPLSVTADIESLKNVSGDFSLYYNKNETSSKNELSTEFVKYVTTTEFNGVNVDVSTLKSASSEWNKVGDKLDTTAFRDVSGNFLTAAPENMATTDDVTKLEQTISETYQVKGDYLKTADSSNFYPSNNPSGFITGEDLSNYYNKTETSSKEELDTAFGSKQDNLTNEQLSAISSVSSIKGTILTGDSNIRATSAEDGNNIKWTLELTDQPTVTDTTLSGYHGIVATKDSTVSSQWNVGIEQAYKEQIEAVSSKLTQDVADTLYAPISVIEDVGTMKTASAGWNKVSDKLDTTSFSDVSGNFLTAHQDISNKLDTTAFSDVSGNFLTAHQNLDEYAKKEWVNNQGFLTEHQPISADEWNKVYETVVANSGTWGTEKDWTDDINEASAYAYEQAISQIPAPFDPTFLSGEIDKKLDKTFSSNFYPMTGNPSGFLTAHQDISTKLDETAFSTVSSNFLTEDDLNAYATKIDLETTSGKLLTTAQYKTDSATFLTAHQNLDAYATKEYANDASANALSEAKTWVGEQKYLTVVPNTYALKTDIPTTVAQLDDSGNYYQKTETSGKTELTNALNTKVDKPSQTGKLVYDGDNNEWVTLPEGTTTIVQGQGSVTSNYDASNSTYTVSLLASAENALNKVVDKIDATAVEQTYQTKADMTNYLTISDASTTYQLIGDYASKSDINDMATQTWVGQQGFYTKASGDNDYAPKTITATVNTLTAASAGWNEVTSKLDANVASTTYQTKEDMNNYLTKSDASTTYQPTGNYLVSDDITGKLDKSIYENASGNWENTYNTVKQYSAAGTWLTAHQSLEDYYKKTETSSTTQLSTEFAKYVTSSDITPDIDYVMTTTGWKELTIPGGGMTQVIHDETLTGQGIDGNNLGVNTEVIQSKLTNAQLSSISSVSGKVDKPIAASAENKYLVYSTNANDSGWCELSAGGDYLPLSGGIVSGGTNFSAASGKNVLAVATNATLIGASRQTSEHFGVDDVALGTTWLGVDSNGMYQGFIKYTNGGNVGDLDSNKTIQINFKPTDSGYGEMTMTNKNGDTTSQSKVVNVPTASYNSMSSFDSTNGPNYMLRKTASGFDIGAAVINVTELPQQIEANAYYFVYDT